MTRHLLSLLFAFVLAGSGSFALAADPAPAAPPAAEATPAPAKSKALTGATVTVGCGMCQLGKTDDSSCKWAVELDGTPYSVEGALPRDHDSHAPDGMCKAKRTAVVDGELSDGKFVATRFELIPLDGAKGK